MSQATNRVCKQTSGVTTQGVTDEESAGVVYVCIFLLEMFVPPIYQALHTSPIALLIRHSLRRDTFPAGEGF